MYSIIIIVLLCVLYIDTCIVRFQVLFQDGDAEVKSLLKERSRRRRGKILFVNTRVHATFHGLFILKITSITHPTNGQKTVATRAQ